METKLPSSFFRFTNRNEATIWVNLDYVATISVLYSGPKSFAGFSLEVPESEETALDVTKPEEVRDLAKLLKFDLPGGGGKKA